MNLFSYSFTIAIAMTKKNKICWQEIPFAPRRFPFFYGWVIVATATCGIISSIPGQTMGVGVFADSLIDALGLTREQLSRCYMFGTIASGLMLPFAGRVLDKLGARIMATIAALGLGVSIIGMSRCDEIVRLLGESISDPVLAAMTVITVCFMLIRFFGQGLLTTTSRVAMGKWFNHHRGLATGIAGVFIAFGFSAAPTFLNWLIETLGWRLSCTVLGAVVAGGFGTLAIIFMRDNPEQCSLVMDGITDEAWLAKMSAKIGETSRQFTCKEAVKTLAFWSFTLGTASHVFLLTAIIFHFSSIAAEASRTRDEAFAIFIPMSLVGIAARFIAGYLSDRIRIKWLLIVMMAAQTIGTVGMLMFASRSGWWLIAMGYGISGGIFGTIMNVTWPRFFGRENLGAIAGLNMSIIVFASAIGPWLFSIVRNQTDSFRAILVACLLMPVAIAGLAKMTVNPQKKFAAQ